MALPLAPLSSLSPSQGATSSEGFVEFDERLLSAQPGTIIVRGPAASLRALATHAARRLRTGGFLAILPPAHAPLFAEVAIALGVAPLPLDPTAAAEVLARAARARRAAIIGAIPAEDSWDFCVARELVAAQLELVLVAPTGRSGLDAPSFVVAADLQAPERLRWLGAIAEEAQEALPLTDLAALETWWARARRLSPHAEARSFDGLSDDARSVLLDLALAGRSIPIHHFVGDPSVLHALELEGLITRAEAHVVVTRAGEAIAEDATDADCVRAARRLEGPGDFEPDPWALARSAELYVRASSFDDAERAIARALQMADGIAAREVTGRWESAVESLDGPDGAALRVRTAERLLVLGDAPAALRWCERAAILSPEDWSVLLLMGRALVQMGDLVAARVLLTKALTRADDADAAARVHAELGEVSYLAGELTSAAEHAKTASASATTSKTRLAARNTLGKILLAGAEWDAADAHFVEDAFLARADGLRAAELRARLNRGIALMSKGRLDDARATLLQVLSDGEAAGEDRARAHALGNLAVIAYRRHEYGEALALWEQTIRFPQALRGRIATARTIANLAELRLRLGLVDHADHAIAFGRRLMGAGTTAARASHFGVVAARIALARQNGEVARREVEAAIDDAEAAHDKDYLGEAFRVLARIALEDGELAGATAAIDRAAELATNERGRAELMILRALLARSQGQPALPIANEALTLARAAGEEDLLAEIHTLLATVHREEDDPAGAQLHARRALQIRDQVAAGLSTDIRAAFLAKPEIVAISRLHATLGQAAPSDEEARRPARLTRLADEASADREIVGDDPQMRALMLAVRKVARSSSTVLVRGESGTGKELIAEALHRASDRSQGPLVSVNCAALVETLLLSELFGHEKGAFTGASARRRGRFELAEGGTLFLDEIGDISPRTQVALLRVLQEKTFERVGGTSPIRANVRVICATHRDLRAMVERGQFREDLYYRLRQITLEIPALRARIADLPRLAAHLLDRIAAERSEAPKTLTPDALDLLARHRWPGNVRELENVLRAVSLFAENDAIDVGDLIDNVDDLRAIAQGGPPSQPISLRPSVLPPPSIAPAAPEGAVFSDATPEMGDDDDSGPLPLSEASATAVAYAQVRQGTVSLSDIKRQIERDCIARALHETKGNITRAASLLGMKRPRLSQLVKQYGLSASPSEGNS